MKRTTQLFWRTSACLAMVLACAGIAQAETLAAPSGDAGDSGDSGDRADILVTGQHMSLATESSTGSRLGLSLLQTPASVAIVDGADIRARGDMSVLDAVTRAPGITSNGNPGNGGTALAARGFSGQGSVLQLVDGIRLFPAAGTITFPTDPWNIDRIEVLNGPASVLYGQGALGGAVNVITKKPNADRTEIEAEAGYGSQDTAHAAAGIGGPINPMFSYRADASYRRSDGYVDRGGSHSLALSGALRFAPIDTLSLTLRDDYGDIHPSKYFGTPLIEGRLDTDNRRRNYNVADAVMWSKDNRLSLTLDWSPSDAITISNVAYYLTSKRKWQNLEIYGYDDATGLINRSDNYGIIHDQKQWGDQGSVKFSTSLGGGISNDLVAGFDVNLIRLRYSHSFGTDPQEDSVDPYDFDPGLFYDTQGIAPRYRTRTLDGACSPRTGSRSATRCRSWAVCGWSGTASRATPSSIAATRS